MNVVLTIEGREAIPLRAVAYVCYWNADPKEIASACATPPTKEIGGYSIRNRHSLPTYLVSRCAHRPMQPVEWEPFKLELECLEKGLKVDERTDDENWARCRKQAVLQLPDGAFVWLDDFQRWFSNTRPLKDAATLSNDGEDDSFENESDALNLDPYIPPEMRAAVLSGFERYQVSDDTTDIAQAKENTETLNKDADIARKKPWLIPAECDPTPELPWYTPARFFARELVKDDSTLLTKRDLLAKKVVHSLSNVGIKKRGGEKPFDPSTVKKALTNVKLG